MDVGFRCKFKRQRITKDNLHIFFIVISFEEILLGRKRKSEWTLSQFRIYNFLLKEIRKFVSFPGERVSDPCKFRN